MITTTTSELNSIIHWRLFIEGFLPSGNPYKGSCIILLNQPRIWKIIEDLETIGFKISKYHFRPIMLKDLA